VNSSPKKRRLSFFSLEFGLEQLLNCIGPGSYVPRISIGLKIDGQRAAIKIYPVGVVTRRSGSLVLRNNNFLQVALERLLAHVVRRDLFQRIDVATM